jgi:hypothetical protein
MKHPVFATLTVVGMLTIAMSCDIDECPEQSCAWYTSQAAAQDDLETFPEACANLDSDDDGIACNESGNEVTVCPTTAACGCSNLRKDECNTPCCSWTVGEGCGCR